IKYKYIKKKKNEKQMEKAKKDYRKAHDLGEDAEVSDADVQKGALNPPIKSFDDDADVEDIKQAEEDNPKYLSHILEQNFLKRKDDDTTELAGISIGIALKAVYRYQTEQGGPYYYEDIPEKDIVKQGKDIAQTVLERIRKIEGLEDVPVMIALYREESQDSPVPGNFFAQTKV